MGTVALRDAAGRPTLEVRSALPDADRTSATVSAGSQPGTFKLVIANSRFGDTDSLDGLTVDPASPNYAVTRINNASSSSQVLVTARDLRGTPTTAGDPDPSSVGLQSQPYIYAVHTGQITYPIAEFVRLVRQTPALARNPVFSAKASTYLRAVEDAVAVHDSEWRKDSTGRSSYIFPKGAPVRFDGAGLPFNQELSLGRTLADLAVFTGKTKYRDKVTALARTLMSDLLLNDRGAYVWHYAWTRGRIHRGWSPAERISEFQPTFAGYPSVETTSDGHIDIAFANLVFRNGLAPSLIGRSAMDRFAATFTGNLITAAADGSPTVWNTVDGTGLTGVFDDIAAGWIPLATYAAGIFEEVHANYDHRQPEATRPSMVFGSANLNHYAQGRR